MREWKAPARATLKSIAGHLGVTTRRERPYDVQLYETLLRLRPWSSQDVVFDVGANDGRTILRLERHLPFPRIFAFEPVSTTFRTLTERTAHLENVRPFQLALGAESGRRDMYLNERAALNSLYPEWGPWDGTEEVEMTTVDRFVTAHELAHIHLLKIDVERLHRQHPGEPGIPRPRLKSVLPEAVPRTVFDAVLTTLAARGQIVQDQGVVRRRGFRSAAAGAERAVALASGIEQLFRRAGLMPPDLNAVVGHHRQRAKAVRDLVRAGSLVVTFDQVQKREIVFHREAIVLARRLLEERLASEQGFLAGEAGRALGISRKYSIPPLEYFDAMHWTRRIADRRIVTRPRPRPARAS